MKIHVNVLVSALACTTLLGAGSVQAATFTQTVGGSPSWLNDIWGTPAAAPSAGNDYVMALIAPNTETIVRTSPRGGTGDGNTTFPGLSLTVTANTRFLIKQLVNQGATIDGDPLTPGAQGTLILNGGRVSFAPNSSTGAGRAGLNLSSIQVNSNVIFDNTDLGLGIIYNAPLAGSGNITIQKETGAMVNRAVTTFGSAGSYTGTITVNSFNTLDFETTTALFNGAVVLSSGANNGQLNVRNGITFVEGDLLAGAAVVPVGVYTGASLDALNTTLGATYFVGAGTLTVVPIPEPASLALLAVGAGAMLLRRRA